MLRIFLILLFILVIPVLWFALFPKTSLWRNRPSFLFPPAAWWLVVGLVVSIMGLLWALALMDTGAALPYDPFVDPV